MAALRPSSLDHRLKAGDGEKGVTSEVAGDALAFPVAVTGGLRAFPAVQLPWQRWRIGLVAGFRFGERPPRFRRQGLVQTFHGYHMGRRAKFEQGE